MPHHVSRRVRRSAVAAGSAIAVLGAGAGTAMATSTSSAQPTKVAVSQGVNPAKIQGATETGATAKNTTMTVSFVLKAQNLSALEAKVEAGWTGSFLTTSQFAAEYGQTPAVVNELESYLSSYGITSTADSDDLDVTATGTAAEFNQALSIGLDDYTVPATAAAPAQKVYASATNPSVSSNLGSDILSILGLSNYAPFVSQALPATTTTAATKAASPSSTNTIPFGERTPADFESQYGLSALDANGDAGQGQTLGIVTLASVNANVPQRFWNILGLTTKPDRITLDDIDGGSGPVSLTSGSDETTLDVEQSGAIAPQANIDVYQAPNTDYGFVDAFFAAASQNVADTVSTSWGESETAIASEVATGTESATYAETFDEAFLEMAAQGQSGFVASGDQGAYDDTDETGTTELAIDNPSDSPFTTAAGATTDPGTQTYPVVNAAGATTAVDQVDIPEQLTWSWDYLWPVAGALGEPSPKAAATDPDFEAGSGGGYSVIEPRPSYQDGVSGVAGFDDYPYLTPTDVKQVDGVTEPTAFTFNANPTLASGLSSTGRASPDVAFDADPQTGYAVYDPQFTSAYGSSIVMFGGTSFVAPQLNGVTAVYDGALGHRVGFWNPTAYAAASSTSSPFTPLDGNQKFKGSEYLSTTNESTSVTSTLPGTFSNNNLYYTGTPGSDYNPGSGLGYANLGKLESVFAAH
jgi:kumamolisin